MIILLVGKILLFLKFKFIRFNGVLYLKYSTVNHRIINNISGVRSIINGKWVKINAVRKQIICTVLLAKPKTKLICTHDTTSI